MLYYEPFVAYIPDNSLNKAKKEIEVADLDVVIISNSDFASFCWETH